MEEVTKVRNIYANIIALLDAGTFQGRHAGLVTEAKSFLNGLVSNLDSTLEKEANEQEKRTEKTKGRKARPSAGDSKDTSGVSGSKVPPKGRKSSKRGKGRAKS